jgi:hypothetical protein
MEQKEGDSPKKRRTHIRLKKLLKREEDPILTEVV